MHISEISKACQVASTLAVTPLTLDAYHGRIKEHARILYNLGKGAYEYVTQYGSGSTVWRIGKSRTLVVNAQGILINQEVTQ